MCNLKHHFRTFPMFVCPLIYFSSANIEHRCDFSCMQCQYNLCFERTCTFKAQYLPDYIYSIIGGWGE